MSSFYAVEIPEGNGYRGNARGILRIHQHLQEKPGYGVGVLLDKDQNPVLTSEGGFYVECKNPVLPGDIVERLIISHYGTRAWRFLTADEAERLAILQ